MDVFSTTEIATKRKFSPNGNPELQTSEETNPNWKLDKLANGTKQHGHWSQDIQIFEPCLFGDIEIDLPVSLLRLEDLGSIINMETWESLSNEEKQRLRSFLPPLEEKEKDKTLPKLFGKENFFFGNPLEDFQRGIKEGIFHKDVARYRSGCIELKKKCHMHDLREYHSDLSQRCIEFKRKMGFPEQELQLQPNASQPSLPLLPYPAEETKEPEAFQTLRHPLDLRSEEKLTMQPFTIEHSTPTTQPQSLAPMETEEGATESDSESSLSESSSDELRYKVERRENRIRKRQKIRHKLQKSRKSLAPKPTPALAPSKPRETRTKPQLSQIYAVFTLFLSLRKLFLESPEKNLSMAELVNQLPLVHSNFLERIPSSYSLSDFVTLLLKFLHCPPAVGNGSHGPLVVPDAVDSSQWQWRRLQVADDYLQSLELLFFFAVSRIPPDQDDFAESCKAFLSKHQKSGLSISPTSDQVVQEFHLQETQRYAQPENAFVYRLQEVSPVAPAKRPGGGSHRAREHFLLKSDRPPHISLLALVRDAVARLPGGVGTRPDVAMLLKDSQFVADGVPDNTINTVVSGALDRLHSEEDPCVGYAADQRLWVYLHKDRKEEDFERFKQSRR